MHKRLKKLSMVLVATLALTGCTNSTTNDLSLKQAYSVAESNLSRNTSKMSAEENEKRKKELAEDNNAFAFDLFSKLSKTETQNLFFSPYSVSSALVMMYAGAKEETKSQMATALHFQSDDRALHSAFNVLDLGLNTKGDDYIFSVANSLWAQYDYSIQQNYLDTLKTNYDANVKLVDYVHKTEASREAINQWVEDKTNNKIQNLLPQGSISGLTRLVITNAVYFKGAWLNEFDQTFAPLNGSFHYEDGSTKKIPVMHTTNSFSYVDKDNYKAVELLYKSDIKDANPKTSMVIILPDDGKFATVRDEIKVAYQDTINNFNKQSISLQLPKFGFTTGVYDLSTHLKALGMVDAFTSADFSGITGDKELSISAVLHKAFINVDEAGTEAAAATAVVARFNSIAPENPIEFSVDRPFIFFIRDIATKQILFIGIVKNP